MKRILSCLLGLWILLSVASAATKKPSGTSGHHKSSSHKSSTHKSTRSSKT